MKKSIPQQIAELPVASQALVPAINIELEPVFQVTPPDLSAFVEIFKQMMGHKKDKHEKPWQIKIDVERDSRNYIKSLTCTEVDNG